MSKYCYEELSIMKNVHCSNETSPAACPTDSWEYREVEYGDWKPANEIQLKVKCGKDEIQKI